MIRILYKLLVPIFLLVVLLVVIPFAVVLNLILVFDSIITQKISRYNRKRRR